MGVAICERPRKHLAKMVARTTVVVFTIVLAVSGVFVPEGDRELEEKDASQKGSVDLLDGGNSINLHSRLRREAGKEKKGKGKKAGKGKNDGKGRNNKKNKRPKGTRNNKKNKVKGKKNRNLKKNKKKGKSKPRNVKKNKKKGKKGTRNNKKGTRNNKKGKKGTRNNKNNKKRNNKKKNRRNKDKILKRLNKMKKRKGLKRKGKQDKQESTSCSDLDCLNNLVFALKIEKDTVRNFLAQEKRVKSKKNLMINKQEKKG